MGNIELIISIVIVASIISGALYAIGYFHAMSKYFPEDDAPEPPDKCTCTYPRFCDKFCITKAMNP